MQPRVLMRLCRNVNQFGKGSDFSIKNHGDYMKLIAALLSALPLSAHAGGSNYGVAPGSNANFAGKVSEWPVPTPRFARDPAIAPDGSIFIAVMSGNKVARFDTK